MRGDHRGDSCDMEIPLKLDDLSLSLYGDKGHDSCQTGQFLGQVALCSWLVLKASILVAHPLSGRGEGLRPVAG